jgi:hypothetical protein
MPGDFESFDTYVDEITPESLLEERKRVSFANLVGAISALPLVYFWLAEIVAARRHMRLPGWHATAPMFAVAIVLSLWAATRGSRWWIATALLSLGTCVLIALH